jgi:hypothetical protein
VLDKGYDYRLHPRALHGSRCAPDHCAAHDERCRARSLQRTRLRPRVVDIRRSGAKEKADTVEVPDGRMSAEDPVVQGQPTPTARASQQHAVDRALPRPQCD